MRRRTTRKHRAADKPRSIKLQLSYASEYVDVHQAASLLGTNIARVYALGRSRALARFFVETSLASTANDVSKPHPWLLDEQRRFAAMSGWQSVPPIRQRSKRRALPKPQRRARLRFRREDVIALKAEIERKGLQIAARRIRVRVLGRDVSWPKASKVRRIRFHRSRVRVAPGEAQQVPIQDPAIGNATRLLSWAAPPRKI